MKNEIRQFALSRGAQVVAMAGVEAYAEYLDEVERRLQDTGAELEDFMISPVANMPGSRDKTFFERLADARDTLPEHSRRHSPRSTRAGRSTVLPAGWGLTLPRMSTLLRRVSESFMLGVIREGME